MKHIIFFFIIISLFSCERVLDTYWENQSQENYTSPYAGKWTGNYSGEDNGTLIITVAKSGSIFGTYGQNGGVVNSSVLDNGSLVPVNSNEPIFTLYGSLNDKKGTWKNNNLKGTWSLTKQ